MASRRDEINNLAKTIVATNDGHCVFNFTEAARILNCGLNAVPLRLASCGVLVTTNGKNKMVTAVGLAECMCHQQVSPLDNRYLAVGAKRRAKLTG